MDRKKLSFSIIGLMGILFVTGLGTHAIPKSEDCPRNIPGWLEALNSVAGPLSPGLDRRRITALPSITTDKSIYRIKNKQTQTVRFGKKEGSRIERAVLKSNQKGVVLKVPGPECSKEPDSKPVARRLSFPGSTRLEVASPAIHSGIRSPRVDLPIELKVLYTPAGESVKTPSEWETVEEVDLVVLEDGGTLRLQCKGCNPNRTVTVKLE